MSDPEWFKFEDLTSIFIVGLVLTLLLSLIYEFFSLGLDDALVLILLGGVGLTLAVLIALAKGF